MTIFLRYVKMKNFTTFNNSKETGSYPRAVPAYLLSLVNFLMRQNYGIVMKSSVSDERSEEFELFITALPYFILLENSK